MPAPVTSPVRHLVTSALTLLLAGCAAAPQRETAPTSPPTTSVHLLAINDFHGNLQPPAPIRTRINADDVDVPVGGIDQLAAHVRAFRQRHAHTLVVSAGDLIGASPLISALFRDEGTIEAMNRIGLDLNAVGNHEFDEGFTELQRMQRGGCHPEGTRTCEGARVGTPVPFEGARFSFLAANVRDTAAANAPIFPAYGVRELAGHRIAFIGMTLRGTPRIVDRAGITGLRFDDEADTVNALIPALRADGIEAIVVLLHEGGDVTGPRRLDTANDCAGGLAGSPLAAIVSRLDDAVDLVISGHTHQAYVCTLTNARGRAITATSARDYGRFVTEIELMLDADGDIARIAATNVPVRRDNAGLPPASDIAAFVGRYAALAAPISQRVVGRIVADLANTAGDNGQSPLGNFIADGQRAATADVTRGGAEIAFMNPGGIRAALSHASSEAGEGDGNVTYGEAFAVQPFANVLVTMTLTGEQLRILLEQQFEGCKLGYPPDSDGQTGTRLLQVSEGFTYAFSSTAPACARVVADSMRLHGKPIDAKRQYRVTVNSFLAAGGDGFELLRQGTDVIAGQLDLDAFIAQVSAPPQAAAASATRVQRLP